MSELDRVPAAGDSRTPAPGLIIKTKKQNRSKVPWTGFDVLAIVVLSTLGNLLFMFVLEFLLRLVLVLTPLNREFTRSPVVTALLLILQWLITLGIALAFLKTRSYKLSLQTLGFRRPPSIFRALFTAAGFVFIFLISLRIYEHFISPAPQDIISEYTPSLLGFVLAFLQVAIMVPVLEELLFRGIIHQGLEHQFGFLPGAIMSASLFALAHLYPSLYPPIFLLGFFFAYLVHRTGSVWPSIAGHMMVNSLAVIAQFTTISQGT